MKAVITDDVIIGVLMGGDPGILDPPGAELWVTLPTLSEVYRAAEAAAGGETARRAVSDLAFLLKILPEPSGERLMSAFNSRMRLADSLLAASAEIHGVEAVVTNRPEAFEGTGLRAYTPEEFLKICGFSDDLAAGPPKNLIKNPLITKSTEVR